MARKTKRRRRLRSLRLPRWLLRAFAVVALLLVPWTLWLSYTLPVNHMDQRWNLAWSGFDVGLLVSMAATAYLGFRKSGWVIVAASMTGTFLIIDAWFDCLTAQNAWEHLSAISSALFIELPLALLAFWIAYRAGRQVFKSK